MLSTSFAFRRYVAAGRHLATRVELQFASGESRTLHGEDLTMGGVSLSSASSAAGRFEIGAAVVGSGEVTLVNYDGRWDDADFTDATCALCLGAELDGGIEWLRMGTYGVSQPESYDSTIALELLDNMRLFQRSYADVPTIFPATLRTIVRDVCQTCGVTMLSATFPGDTQVVSRRPQDSNVSCLDVLSWTAQMACCFCDVDPWGRLRVRWYDTSAFEAEDWLDGGTFDTATTPYSDGDAADGGWFHYGGAGVDGGDFSNPPWAVVSAIKTLTTSTDDVVVTGVRVVASDEVRDDGAQGAAGEECLAGSDGYVLAIEGNPLVEYGHAQSVASVVGPRVIGMRFRPLSVSAIGDPAIEAGDPLLVIDRRQRTYRAYATGNTWKHGGFQSLACSAETPARNRADIYGAQTRAIVQQRNAQRAEVTARELAVRNLARELSEAGGLYKTEQEQQDHSVVYYLHDKPNLAESQIVWKMNSQAFAVSVDGGRTYPFGFDAWGNAILNAIYAIGIDASYIDTGQMRVGPAANPLFFADFDTGEARLASSVKIGGQTAQQIASGAASSAIGALTPQEVLNKLTNNGAMQGIYISNGQLYIHGSYVHGGTIVSGGMNNSNGIIQVKDASGNVICQFDNTGAKIVGDVNMLASCNLFNYASPNLYDRRAETTIGIMRFTDSNIFGNLVGSYVSSDDFCLPGMRVTGVNGYNGSTMGYIQIIPPIQGSYKRASIFSEDPIYIFSSSANTSKGAGIYTSSERSGIEGRNSATYVRVYNSDSSTGQHVDIRSSRINITGTTAVAGTLSVSGTKSRMAETESYGSRLLYCYETPAPLFGDVGSGVIGEDGTCVVSIDDVFTECSRTDMGYQAFLQKCGPGDLWVSEKAPGYFVVEGTPGLAFDWETKAHQAGYELERLEDAELRDEADNMGKEDLSPLDAYEADGSYGQIERLYEEELGYIKEIESLYEEAA